MHRNNRGPVPFWQLALYIAVLGFISLLLAPLTALWWIVPVLGAAAPVALAVLQAREHRNRATEDVPESTQDTRTLASDGDARSRPAEGRVLEGGVSPEAAASAHAIKPDAPESGLSERELEVLALLAAGKTNAEVADALFISIGTVKSHSANIYRKLEAKNRTEAVTRARELGLLG